MEKAEGGPAPPLEGKRIAAPAVFLCSGPGKGNRRQTPSGTWNIPEGVFFLYYASNSAQPTPMAPGPVWQQMFSARGSQRTRLG